MIKTSACQAPTAARLPATTSAPLAAAMNNATRHRRIAERSLTSILQKYGKEAPAVLREWAEEFEAYVAEAEGDPVAPVDPRRAEGFWPT